MDLLATMDPQVIKAHQAIRGHQVIKVHRHQNLQRVHRIILRVMIHIMDGVMTKIPMETRTQNSIRGHKSSRLSHYLKRRLQLENGL